MKREKLEIYDMSSNFIKNQERKEFYKEVEKEYEEKGQITRKVKTIRLILVNSKGNIYVQKRSKIKKQNRGLYDKTIGGHVSAEESYKLTVARECVEELGVPSVILEEHEFNNAIKNIDLSVMAILKRVEYIDNFMSERIIENKGKVIQPQMTEMYIGYYDGPIKFFDGECSGVELLTVDELIKEIEEEPNKYTEDLKFMIMRYKEELRGIRE